MGVVESILIKEGECVWVGNVRVVVAHARGGKVVLGTPLQDEAGPFCDDSGLTKWAAQVQAAIARSGRHKNNGDTH